jgi:hypothetical protein
MNPQQAKGHWALVTGASSGIGLQFCHELASAGMHLVMVARRENLLRELAQDLAKTSDIQTLVLAVDLSKPGAAAQVKARLDENSIKIRLLCNNAAFGRWGRFEMTSAEVYEEMIHLNVAAIAGLCCVLLPDLASHSTSAIINVSSQAAYQPVPFMAVYAATKAFVHSFSQALYGEWKDRGVLVQTLVPSPTDTESARAYPSSTGDRRPPKEIVQTAIAHLDIDRPVVSNARGLYKQRLFAGLAPSKTVINTLAKMFRPPTGA